MHAESISTWIPWHSVSYVRTNRHKIAALVQFTQTDTVFDVYRTLPEWYSEIFVASAAGIRVRTKYRRVLRYHGLSAATHSVTVKFGHDKLVERENIPAVLLVQGAFVVLSARTHNILEKRVLRHVLIEPLLAARVSKVLRRHEMRLGIAAVYAIFEHMVYQATYHAAKGTIRELRDAHVLGSQCNEIAYTRHVAALDVRTEELAAL